MPRMRSHALPAGAESAAADVLIVTALREERDAVKAVTQGALGPWTDSRAPSTELRIERCAFRAVDGGILRVALICAEEMGGAQTVGVAGPVVMALRPRCLAMCGVLAGKPKDTELGDVVLADQLLQHDTGKRMEGGLEHATRPHKLDIRWLEKARDFAEDPGDALVWLDAPAWTPTQERAWLLDQFSRGFDPLAHKALLDECCPSYRSIVEKLLADALVQPGPEPLTEKGRAHVMERRFSDPRWPGLDPPRRSTSVRVGPMASGSAVQGDSALWKELSIFARKALGVEMESHAVGTTAELHQVELALVMKGVMDHADVHKDDRFKSFAARASAECLLAFLRRYLPTDVHPGFDDLLVPGTAEPPRDPSPSALLTARFEVVPFRRAEQGDFSLELEQWCDDLEPVRARLLHAEGGSGKTRLAIEQCKLRRHAGWAAGFLREPAPANWFEKLHSLRQPLLVVLDYAESRVDLSSLLAPVLRYRRHAGQGSRQRVRILLLARSVGDWWDALRSSDSDLAAFLGETPPCGLPPVAEVARANSRADVFREAAAAFARILRKSAVEEPPLSLDDPAFDRVLYLHMAALAAVERLAFTAESLTTEILDHEERFWEQRATTAPRNDLVAQINRSRARCIVAAATLRGGLADANAAVSVTASLLGSDDVVLRTFLRNIYGAQGEARRPAFLPPLEPDLLGEAMVLRTMRRMAERPKDYLDRVFADDDGPSLQVGFELLGRLSVTHPEEALPWIEQLLGGDLAKRALPAFAAAKALGTRTAYSELGSRLADALVRSGDLAIAAALERHDIPERTVSLGRVATWALRTLVRAGPPSTATSDLGVHATRLSNLGNWEAQSGRLDAALSFAQEAVRIRHELVKRDPDAFLQDLASSLDNLERRTG